MPSLRNTRRTFLRGAGVLLGLPWLEGFAFGRGLDKRGPKRLIFVYVPNGMHMSHWTPAAEGKNFPLSPTLTPLAPYHSELLLLSGLTHDKARANGDGPGDHARAAAAFLTGAQPRKTSGADLRAGISADQIAAQALGTETRLRSLELGCESTRASGECDSGYACAYSNHIAWAGPSTPLPKETNPRALYDRLFLGGRSPEEREQRKRLALQEQSILDWVREDAERLQRRLGQADRARLEEYSTSVRELERRLAAFAKERPLVVDPAARPEGVPENFAAYVRLMFDVLVLALRTDSTRIATFMIANEGSNRAYPEVGAPEGHHELSHHGDDPEKLAKIARINLLHSECLAHFLAGLAAVEEGEYNLLANSVVVYGSAIADGNRHDHHDLPLLLAGSAGGKLTTGRHLRYPKDTPATNLYRSLLAIMGHPLPSIGDSTGLLSGLDSA